MLMIVLDGCRRSCFAALQCQPGFVCNKSDLSTDLRGFMNWGVFQDVQARVAEGKDGKVGFLQATCLSI